MLNAILASPEMVVLAAARGGRQGAVGEVLLLIGVLVVATIVGGLVRMLRDRCSRSCERCRSVGSCPERSSTRRGRR
jgi:hypothetical protein